MEKLIQKWFMFKTNRKLRSIDKDLVDITLTATKIKKDLEDREGTPQTQHGIEYMEKQIQVFDKMRWLIGQLKHVKDYNTYMERLSDFMEYKNKFM